ncbi:hypothetical protein PAXRUDRAFT_134662 [Paxillus rubicundulus Ve08.2h10]|uniref:XRRM domain-containing protein n=1 Tax=Paxillus rubicundulus Ve08.2h10 TaxID=930991 RepID=A0A0D0EBT9_9AGAM|nr:hypothetical protein PAXRUDRAFT_134662 [Paxillus rubicundulus Ve08.2h10]
MAAPFAFVPRTVSKQAKSQGAPSAPRSQPPAPPSTTDSEPEDEAPEIRTLDKGKSKAVDPPSQKQSTIGQDIAALISLSLSDYNIWVDADLRRKLYECLQYAESPDGAGFVPVNYLIRRSPFHGSLSSEPSETEAVKALRTYKSDTLEVRMLVSAPSSSVWYGPGKTSRKKDVGGYEVRRKDWANLLDHPSRSWTRARWDETTVYMESVPIQYRTIAGITRFAEALLPQPPKSQLLVQNVTLPPHYLDKPGDVPKCKGYALATFSVREHSETLLQKWPWRRRITSADTTDIHDTSTTPVEKEALKFGFRTISKSRWNQLNEEYLIYKRRLVDEMAEANETPARYSVTEIEFGDVGQAELEEPAPSPPLATKTTWSSPYPFNCLVFVRNIHTETNKTTLKALFSQAFQIAEGQVNGIDYVDFNKGMDTCYLRLASPHHTTLLTEYFIEQLTAQSHGLDATGRGSAGDNKPILVEIIQGKKEELYWEKVPEKVRRQAVDKVVKAQQNSAAGFTVPSQDNTSGGQKKRKHEP